MSALEPREPRSESTDLVPVTPVERAITAQDILGALVDVMKTKGVPITSRARGIIGKQAKELLADGFAPEVIYAAASIALRRSQPHITHHIAQDIALAAAGEHLTPSEWRRELALGKQQLDPVAMREADERLKANIHKAVQKSTKRKGSHDA